MGRLIDVADIRIKPNFMHDIMGMAMIRCEDLSRILADIPAVDAIPRERIEQMVAELYKEADLMIDGEGEDCMAILIDDAIDIIHEYTKEQNNE